QPGAVVWQREAVEELLDHGAFAVRHAVGAEIAAAEIRGHHFERAARGAAAATEDAAILRLPEPLRLRLPLQRSRGGRLRREVQPSRLRARVELEQQRVVVLPPDPEPCRLAD